MYGVEQVKALTIDDNFQIRSSKIFSVINEDFLNNIIIDNFDDLWIAIQGEGIKKNL